MAEQRSQRDRRAEGGVAARGPEIDRGRRKTTRGHRNRAADTPAMALRRKIRASSYNQGGEDWHDAFKRYDNDDSGELDFEEFKRAIRRTAKISPAQISDRELKKLFKLIDIDRGGSISADELIAFLNGAQVISMSTCRALRKIICAGPTTCISRVGALP